MQNMILQVQLLLAALSAFLPLVPPEHRGRIAEVLDIAGKALSVSAGAAANLDDLTRKLAAIRAEIEAMAARGERVSTERFEAATMRLRAASAEFRQALAETGAG